MKPRTTVQTVTLGAALLVSGAAWSDSRAVDALNFEMAVSSINSDTEDSTSSGTLGADLLANVPIGSYFGLFLGGQYSKSTVRTRDVLEDENGELEGTRPSCKFESYGGEAGLYFRLPKYGRIGGSYGQGNLSPDCDGGSLFPVNGEDKLGTDSYRFDAEIYLGDFTLGGAHTTTKLEDGPELESTEVTASWYPIDSVKVSLSGNDLYDENTYGILVEHQPEMMGDGFSVRLGYSMVDQSPKTTTFNIGLSYYFGTKVPLKIRDRQYR